MKATIHRVPPGPQATDWLITRVRAIQGDDPLAPVTVLAPDHYAGLYLRRTLAARGGYAAVRFTILPRLAEMLGSARLGRDGKLPMTSAVRGGLIRMALRSDGGRLREAADQAGLVDLVARLATDLRRSDDPDRDRGRIRTLGNPTSVAALDAIKAYERFAHEHHRYDEAELILAAADAVDGGEVVGLLRDVGAVILFLPERIEAPNARLLSALNTKAPIHIALADMGATPGEDYVTREGTLLQLGRGADDAAPTPATVVIAPDALEEARAAVRGCVAALERETPVPLYREAIVYRDEDAYAQVLRDTLTVANIPFSSLDGRPLSDTISGRSLLGLVRLREQDFARSAVLAWLSALPHRSGVLRNQARWDQLSRRAGVVRGVEQWTQRLGRFVEDRGRDVDRELAKDPGSESGTLRAIRRDIADAADIVEQITTIATLTARPDEHTWTAHVAWLQRLRKELLAPDQAWNETEIEADQLVGQIVEGLGAAHDIEPDVDVRVVLRTLDDALRSRRTPEGRLGAGILIGPYRMLLGHDLDRVHILGVLEGMFPAAPPVNPLLAGDPLETRAQHEADERRAWDIALHVAPEIAVSVPLVDVDGRDVYASPWLCRLFADGGASPSASRVRDPKFTHERLHRVGAFPSDSALVAPLTLHERREWEALRAQRAHIDVATIGLAQRPDLPLQRAITATRARRSAELTEFDGNLATAAQSPILAAGITTRMQSATAIEGWATCPFRHLLARILWVAQTEHVTDERWWQMSALERGSLIHRILERFFEEVHSRGAPPPGSPYGPSHIARIDEIATHEFEEVRKRGIVGHPLVWENEQASIRADLRTLLARDAEMRGEGGWLPAHLEQPFGMGTSESWPAATVQLPDGRVVTFRGFIDRVDTAPAGARVIDYKTGSKPKEKSKIEDRIQAGTNLQLVVYAQAVRAHAAGEGDQPPDVTAMYWYPTTRGEFHEEPLAVSPAVDAMAARAIDLIDRGVRDGCFPIVPGDYNDFWGSYDNCGFCPFNSLCPASRDVVAASKRDSPGAGAYRRLIGDAADGDGRDDGEDKA